MSETKDRNHHSKCCCSWDECGKWCQILRDSDEREYKDLGTISRVTLGQENLPRSYLKCASKHLKFNASKYKNNKYLYVAKHHFPHEYIRDNKKSLKITKPITKEQANLHGITTFDDTNIAVKGTKTQPTTYFLAPVVTKSTVKRLIDNIMIGGGDRQKRACKRRREKDTVTITTTKPAARDEACILPSIADPVTSITQYCPPVESLKDLIRRVVICETNGMESSDGYTLNKKLQENEHFRNISTLLKDFHKYTGHLELGTNQYMYMCKGNEKDCQKTIIYKTKCQANFTTLCATCQKSRRNAKRRQDRMDQNGKSWVHPSSKVNLRFLSSPTKKRRLSNRRKQVFEAIHLVKAMQSQKEIELDPAIENDRLILNFILGSQKITDEQYTKFHKELVNELCCAVSHSKDESDDMEGDSAIRKDITDFVNDVLSKIRNFRLVKEGKSKQVRFTPREIRMALSMYSMSSSGFKEMANSSLAVFPSVRRVKQWRAEMSVEEGMFPETYGRLKERLSMQNKKQGPIYVQLLVDEMNLQSGIYTNVMTNKVEGLVQVNNTWEDIRNEIRNEAQDLVEEVNAIVDGEKDDLDDNDHTKTKSKVNDGDSHQETKNFVPAKYVNQWRIRTPWNQTANVEFFFNDGSLTGNELLYQCLRVMSQLNNVNIITLVLIMDAGGGNSRLASLLRHDTALPTNMSWLPNDMISFKNPTSCNRAIITAIAHCSTHNLKALRNAFLNSSIDEKVVRYFQSKAKIRFTWNGCIGQCFIRDQVRSLPETHLSRASVYPNQWNKMRVGEALRVFSEKTLVEQFTFLGTRLECIEKMRFSGSLNESKDICAMHKKRLEILQNEMLLRKEDVVIDEQFKEALAGLEFSVYVACIFNENFMNKAKNITLANIDKLESEMQENLKYFEDWILETETVFKNLEIYKGRKKKDQWRECCIDRKTYNNLRIQVRGFFFYARNLMTLDSTVKFVPFLFSNQSSLESFFSQVRARGADSPQKYNACVSAMETTKTARSLNAHGNQWYNGTVLEDEEQVAVSSFESAFANNARVRKEKVMDWLSNGLLIRSSMEGRSISILDETSFETFKLIFPPRKDNCDFDKYKSSFQRILDIVKKKKIQGSFIQYLIENTTLVRSAEACVDTGSSTETWFHTLFTLPSHIQICEFDKSCQKVIAKVLQLFRDTVIVGNRSRFSSIWYNLFYVIDKENFFDDTGPFGNLPQELKSNQCGLYMVVEQLVKLVEKWIVASIKDLQIKEHAEKIDSVDERNHKIVNFVGFAVASTIKKYQHLQVKAIHDNDQVEAEAMYAEIGTFVRRMRILHEDALKNVEYVTKHYSTFDQMENHGGKALISIEFMDFAVLLTAMCDEQFSEQKLAERGKGYLREGISKVMEDEKLKEVFMKCAGELTEIMKKHIDNIFKIVVQKTCRARCSFELYAYRQHNVGHYAKESVIEAHRKDLKKYAKPQMKNAGEKLEMEVKKKKVALLEAKSDK